MKKTVLVAVISFVVGLLVGVGLAYKLLSFEPKEIVFQLKEPVKTTA